MYKTLRRNMEKSLDWYKSTRFDAIAPGELKITKSILKIVRIDVKRTGEITKIYVKVGYTRNKIKVTRSLRNDCK